MTNPVKEQQDPDTVTFLRRLWSQGPTPSSLVYSSSLVAHMAASVVEYSEAGCHVNIRRRAQIV
jgi:hypothetical protein